MKLFIDCFKLVKGEGKSVGIYNLTKNLVENLSKLASGNGDVELCVVGNNHNKNDFELENVHFISCTKLNPLNKMHCILWETFFGPLFFKKYHADKVLFPRGFSGIIHPVDDYIIIHDLIPFFYDEKFPDFFDKLENFYIMKRLKQSARSCTKIITISESSKNDIVKYCGVKQEKIVVINNGVNRLHFDSVPLDHKSDYICAITSALPHKNAKGILESYKVYFDFTPKPMDLYVVGIDDTSLSGYSENLKKHVHCFKFISKDEDLHRLIANANLFLFLSLAEGFGFPPIEAMQLGTPVVCSNNSSLPEVCGNAAVLVNPNDYQEVANAIVDLSSNYLLREELVLKGIKNVKRFSWNVISREYFSVLYK